MKRRIPLLATCALLYGCGATAPLVVLDVDQRLLERCSKTLPVLTSGSDTDNLEWSKAMLGLYAKCAKNHGSLATVIEAYNEKVVKAANGLEAAGTSGTPETERLK